jgi:hypothetical protein
MTAPCWLRISATTPMLANEAARRQIPYLCVTATNGGWGGIVALATPYAGTGCWMCLQHLRNDGTIPPPPAAPDDDVIQPAGCATPTFTGSGFDLDTIALHAVRVAVGVLLAGRDGSYPGTPDAVAVVSLRTPDGAPTLPTLSGYQLERHPRCANH